MIKLSEVSVGSWAEILKIDVKEPLKQRLMDIGLITGAKVKVLHKSPAGNPRGYLIGGAVIALRNEDAGNIYVNEVEHNE